MKRTAFIAAAVLGIAIGLAPGRSDTSNAQICYVDQAGEVPRWVCELEEP